MKILIKNINLISMSEERKKYEENIDVLIEDKIIKKIDKNIDCAVDKIIDGTDKILMPGLINTHAHVPMSIFRETLDGLDLQTWLNDKIWPMEDNLTEEDMYDSSLLSYIEMIKTGTTTINDMYFMVDNIIKAALDSGIRLQTTRTLMSDNREKRKNDLSTLIDKYSGYDTITFNAGIHSLYTNDEEALNDYLDYCKNNKLNIHMHFCENSKELIDIENSYNKKPIEIVEKYFKGYKSLFAHCTKLSKEDIKRLSKYDISVAHCPVSNLKLGCGIADINEMINNNINVSLGTDGQGSGCNLDMFEVMKLTALLQKGINEDPKILPAYEVLKMATINGAKALGLEDKIGSIKEGKLADLIILDINNVKMLPVNDIFSDIVYNVTGENVITTIINGKILMENRKLYINNEQEVYKNCKNIINRIKIC